MHALIRRWRPVLLVLLLALAHPTLGAQETPPAEAEYVASSRGQVYYWKGCSAWRRLAVQNRRYFRTAEEARAAGYRPSQQRGCAGPGAGGAPRPDSAGTSDPRPAPTAPEGAMPIGPTTTCRVSYIVDGDTFDCAGGGRVRLLLVDTPERNQDPYGEMVRDSLRALLPLGTEVQLEWDVQLRDPYDRYLAYVYAPGVGMLNVELARRGLAVVEVYPPNVRHVEVIRRALEEARAARRGFWSGSAFDCRPRDQRAGRCRD